MAYPSHAQLVTLYESHEEVIQCLTQQSVITLVDLDGQHKNVLCRLASDYWSLITLEGRESLLSHSHHFVSSCAVISNSRLEEALVAEIQDLPIDGLRIRLQDLNRRATEMEMDLTVQSSILIAGSKANQDMTLLNVERNQVRNRLHALGQPDTPKHYVWI